ncbi:MAG: histidinol dehydrogenase [Clostridiales Family XIII bacterium]|jgi:histidinol dehydrogenase|nr:histidinol dehydrogenase [Clostridiales Family XIII bacterium]
MIRTIQANNKSEFEAIARIGDRGGAPDADTEATVREILENVRLRGDEAVRAYGLAFDGCVPDRPTLTREDMKAAFDSAPCGFRDAITAAAENIRRYHEKQVVRGYELRGEDGVVLGQIVRGLSRVGLYVPGGTAAYPSTVLMNAIPAKIAGVEELIMVTPPGKTGEANPLIAAAAFAAGVDRAILIGGAQAVAALAYGTETVPKVDKIVGPGNVFVAAAKRMIYGVADIDMIAGPSEILILADAGANPAFVAADLLSQAEHDARSASVLLTTDEGLAERVAAEIETRLDDLDRGETARASIDGNGLIIICRSDGEMTALANHIAPEHLEILTEEPMALLPEIRNAGSVFLGPWSPEPLGDYYAGSNHVLPTSGTARFASPLGVYDFVKRMSYTRYTKEALKAAKDDIIEIGNAEGLTAHTASIRVRFEGEGSCASEK